MFIKLIQIGTTPDRRQEFLDRQQLWNAEMSKCPGFIDAVVASAENDDGDIFIISVWRDSQCLEAFMADAHDRIEETSGIRAYYDHIKVSLLDVEDGLLGSGAGHLLFGSGAEGIVALSEAYRASIILRTGLTSGFFESVGNDGETLENLTRHLSAPQAYVASLAWAFTAMGLVTLEDNQVLPTHTMRTFLLGDSPAYLGHLVLHNTQPFLWQRWGDLQNSLDLKNASPVATGQEIFTLAMGDIAAAGQADQLLKHVNLEGHQRLLDIGGAAGEYAIALAERYPDLTVDILDVDETKKVAKQRIDRSPAAKRLSFIVGDYRRDLPQDTYDAVLLSNVLRGESDDDGKALLAAIANTLSPYGLLIVQDLFPDTPAGVSGILSSFFALHLPDALNPNSDTLIAMLEQAGFTDIKEQLLDQPIVANKVILARRNIMTAH